MKFGHVCGELQIIPRGSVVIADIVSVFIFIGSSLHGNGNWILIAAFTHGQNFRILRQIGDVRHAKLVQSYRLFTVGANGKKCDWKIWHNVIASFQSGFYFFVKIHPLGGDF